MKKILAIITVAAITVVAGSAMAFDTNTLTVSASVKGTCKFVSDTSSLSFGTLDPSVGTNVNATNTTQFWCTKGVTETIDADEGKSFSSGKRGMKDSAVGGTDVIPYTLTLVKDGIDNAGPGVKRTLTFNGQVLGTDYTSKNASTYSDTVTLTFTP
jgi:spore coat protein U-like protein